MAYDRFRSRRCKFGIYKRALQNRLTPSSPIVFDLYCRVNLSFVIQKKKKDLENAFVYLRNKLKVNYFGISRV